MKRRGKSRSKATTGFGYLYVAGHEAGHVVANLAVGGYSFIDYATVTDLPPDCLGYVSVEARCQPCHLEVLSKLPSSPSADKMKHRIRLNAYLDVLEYLAGPIAELRFKGHSSLVRYFCAHEAARQVADLGFRLDEKGDEAMVRKRLFALSPTTVERDFTAAWEHAETLLSPHWKKVDELARWLHRVGRIDGDDLRNWWQGFCVSNPPLYEVLTEIPGGP